MQREFCTFYLGDGLFGIDVLLVKEVHRNFDVTVVDRAPDFVVGVMNLRGQVVTVVDPGARLGMEAVKADELSGCIVLKTTAELQRLKDEGMSLGDTTKDATGLLVDRVADMVAVDDRDIKPAPANVGGVDGAFIAGIVQLEKELLVILKVDRILAIEAGGK